MTGSMTRLTRRGKGLNFDFRSRGQGQGCVRLPVLCFGQRTPTDRRGPPRTETPRPRSARKPQHWSRGPSPRRMRMPRPSTRRAVAESPCRKAPHKACAVTAQDRDAGWRIPFDRQQGRSESRRRNSRSKRKCQFSREGPGGNIRPRQREGGAARKPKKRVGPVRAAPRVRPVGPVRPSIRASISTTAESFVASRNRNPIDMGGKLPNPFFLTNQAYPALITGHTQSQQ